MNYYEDLIKQKQEKRNSAESHLKGLIGKKFKRDTDLERAVNGSIYTEISDWSHPRMVVFDKYTDEKYILTTEDNNKYGKDQEFWISKVQKVNSQEEKDNSTVARGTVHGHKYEVDRMSDGSYMGYVYDEDDFPIFKTGLHSTSSGAEQEIKSKVFNSKENSMNYYAKLAEEKKNK